MVDNHGRDIRYLRLSITDLCNLRCVYCMPEWGVAKLGHRDIMSIEEMEDIVLAAVDCGVEKVRITGGEPLVRNGVVELCRRISRIPGVRELCLTTNGVRLGGLAGDLRAAGVDRINLSLDTLKPERFSEITRGGSLETVLDGVRAAEEAGFRGMKINTVLMGGVNDGEIPDFVELTRDKDIQVRFIELMPIGQCANWDSERFISADTVLSAVPGMEAIDSAGVAALYRVPGYLGAVGQIRPISNCFCHACDRIRITADGRLKACLHSTEETILRGLPPKELRETIANAIWDKPQRHRLGALSPSKAVRNMNEIGG